MWAVKHRFPTAKMHLLSNVSFSNANYATAQGILPAKGLFDGWLSYPTQASKVRSILALAMLLFQIRREKFDTVVYLMTRNRQPSQIARDLKFFSLAGIKQVIGTKYLLKNHLPPEAVAPLPELIREYEFLLNSLAADGVEINADGHDPMELLLSEAEKSYAADWLRTNCGEAFGTRNLIAVAPGSKWDSKIWDETKFTETLLRLITNKDSFPIIFGGPEDRDKGGRILKALGKGANAAGQLGIREATAALAYCSLYLGNDTGTMHMAAVAGTPSVAIFAAIDYPGRWHPFGENNVILRRKVPCEGCHAPECKFNRECLDISADEVYSACVKVLENAGK
jgi:heptosyltransferase-2